MTKTTELATEPATPQPTDLLGEIYQQWLAEMSKYPDMSTGLLRIIFDDWQRATAEPLNVTYANETYGGVPGLLATPVGARTDEILLFLHGGGFALGSSASHRKLAGHLANALGAPAFVADFRLAPENPYPAGLEDALSVFRALRFTGRPASRITPVGDSAGGNLAISLVLQLMAAREDLPSHVVVMSPWLNMENTGATLETNDATDFLIAREGLQANIDRYLSGGASAVDPFVNPLYADFTGFPRLYICAGAVESLLDDSLQLHQQASRDGVDVTLSIGEDMQHVFPFLAGRHRRADEELAAIASWYRAGHQA